MVRKRTFFQGFLLLLLAVGGGGVERALFVLGHLWMGSLCFLVGSVFRFEIRKWVLLV